LRRHSKERRNEKKATLAVKLPISIKETHWPKEGKGRTNEDLEGDKPPPAPDQDLEHRVLFRNLLLTTLFLI